MKRFLISITLLTAVFTKVWSQDTLITLNIDFGNQDSALPWNNVINSNTGTLSSLTSTQGIAVPISITIHDAFNGTNNSGTTNPAPSINMPSTATGDSFFGNNVLFGGGIEPTGGVKITGLDTSKKYDLSIFASRIASDNRETQYNINGATTEVKFLQVSNNVADFAMVNQFSPNSNGEIEIIASTGPNNDNTNGFFYLGAIRIQYAGQLIIPDPKLSLIYPNGNEYWQTNRKPEIRWKAIGIIDSINLEYSTDQGNNWNAIAKVPALLNVHTWDIPTADSKNCLVRITADTFQLESQEYFEISSVDTATCHIVVLGSSTAAGAGPSRKDSAWVWKFRDILFQNDTRFKVSNLARGGFTTYNILPDDGIVPSDVNQTIDSTRNISAAMKLNPDALIINLPSNDAANGYTVETQINNYNSILELPKVDSIPYWICTTQPRNGFTSEKIQIQEAMRDSTFSIFGNFSIDFWTDIATNLGGINPDYNSGDGVHLNDAGHQLLLERVLGANINTYLLDQKTDISKIQNISSYSELLVYPNPSQGAVYIDQFTKPFLVSVYDINGNLIIEKEEMHSNQVNWPGKGVFYLIVIDGKDHYLSKVLKL